VEEMQSLVKQQKEASRSQKQSSSALEKELASAKQAREVRERLAVETSTTLQRELEEAADLRDQAVAEKKALGKELVALKAEKAALEEQVERQVKDSERERRERQRESAVAEAVIEARDSEIASEKATMEAAMREMETAMREMERCFSEERAALVSQLSTQQVAAVAAGMAREPRAATAAAATSSAPPSAPSSAPPSPGGAFSHEVEAVQGQLEVAWGAGGAGSAASPVEVAASQRQMKRSRLESLSRPTTASRLRGEERPPTAGRQRAEERMATAKAVQERSVNSGSSKMVSGSAGKVKKAADARVMREGAERRVGRSNAVRAEIGGGASTYKGAVGVTAARKMVPKASNMARRGALIGEGGDTSRGVCFQKTDSAREASASQTKRVTKERSASSSQKVSGVGRVRASPALR